MPELISSYRLEEEIARGGMAIVYRGVHTVFDEVVAVKAIFAELTLNPELRERFLNEAKIQRRLQHPNIVQIREFLIDQGKFYIVMEYVEGETLQHHLHQSSGPMVASDAIEVFRQALDGLSFAHQRGVIHRDIKPSNIMLTRAGVAKLTDFGIARALGSARLTRTGTAVGTPVYMSPEQIHGKKLDCRADIYSMGITLYEMVTGHVPFDRPKGSDSDFPVLAAHISQYPKPPSHWVPEIPSFLEAAILKALEKTREKRFASCLEFQAALLPSPLPTTRKVVVQPKPPMQPTDRPALGAQYLPSRPEPGAKAAGVPRQTPQFRLATAQKEHRSLLEMASAGGALLVLIVSVLAWVGWPRPRSAPLPIRVRQEEATAPANQPVPVAATYTSNVPINPPSPEPHAAQIVVRTSPDAQVYLDDGFKGEAGGQGRLVIDDAAPGNHNLRVSLAGKRDNEQRVSVAAGQVAVLEVALIDAELPSPPTPIEAPRPRVSAPRAGPVRENAKDGLKYVWVDPGTFTMGCSAGDDECLDSEKPAHQVTISRGFWVGQTPVTVSAYLRFSGSNGRRMPPAPTFNVAWADENMPIVNVTWNEAQAYCGWVGGRLPTEAEWEYAARGGSSDSRYGNLDEVAWYNNNSGRQTHEVAQKRANGFGLHDVLGNVWEWCNDWYDDHYYPSSPLQDPQGPGYGQFRVLRGGSWSSYFRLVRASYRFRVYPNVRITDLGFRCDGEVGNP